MLLWLFCCNFLNNIFGENILEQYFVIIISDALFVSVNIFYNNIKAKWPTLLNQLKCLKVQQCIIRETPMIIWKLYKDGIAGKNDSFTLEGSRTPKTFNTWAAPRLWPSFAMQLIWKKLQDKNYSLKKNNKG